MFLSNAGRAAGLFYLFAALAAGCGSSQPPAYTAVTVTPAAQKGVPFPLKEPEIYQAEVHITTAGTDERFGIVRKGERWRFDIFDGTVLASSQVRSDSLYYIDHVRKLIATADEPGDPMTPSLPPDPMQNFYRGRQHFDFEESGRDGTTIRYRLLPGGGSVYYDTAVGLITRQEFLSADGTPEFVYQLRDIKMEVDDSLFQLPKGYRKTSLAEVQPEK